MHDKPTADNRRFERRWQLRLRSLGRSSGVSRQWSRGWLVGGAVAAIVSPLLFPFLDGEGLRWPGVNELREYWPLMVVGAAMALWLARPAARREAADLRDHRLAIERGEAESFRGVCSCGWTGEWRDRRGAMKTAERHLAVLDE